MNRFLKLALAAVVLVSSTAFLGANPAPASATGPSLNMLANAIFDNTTAMSESQIQSFLTIKNTTDFSNDQTCLSAYQTPDFNWNGSSYVYGPNVLASHVIYKAAQEWGINPQVIIATLQKEEALPHGSDCGGWRYVTAMGYDCPTSPCATRYPGFTKQVLYGAWQLKWNRLCSEDNGNFSWPSRGTASCGGKQTPGSRPTSSGGQPVAFDGQYNICNTGGANCQTWTIANGATASLLTYTPFYPQMFGYWINEVIAFSGGSALCTGTDQANVYRFWSQHFNNTHFFTTNVSERDALFNDPNWKYEGVGYCAVTAAKTGYLPVYRYWSPRFGNTHFFTTNVNERDALMSDPNWAFEGTAFYVPSSTAVNPLAKSVSRYWSPRFNNDHFFTATDGEKSALSSDASWRFEGVGWYAELPQ